MKALTSRHNAPNLPIFGSEVYPSRPRLGVEPTRSATADSSGSVSLPILQVANTTALGWQSQQGAWPRVHFGLAS